MSDSPLTTAVEELRAIRSGIGGRMTHKQLAWLEAAEDLLFALSQEVEALQSALLHGAAPSSRGSSLAEGDIRDMPGSSLTGATPAELLNTLDHLRGQE